MLKDLMTELNKAANPSKAKILAGFFKTGKAEYGEGDVFLGIMVPKQREMARKYIGLKLKDIQILLNSKYHEYRLVGLIILVEKFPKAEKGMKEKMITFYLKNAKKGNINNWDLVDLSAPKILGEYLFDKNKKVLYNLARSKKIWEKRVAVLSTYSFIKKGKYEDILKISKILINDKHDLIHKAVGWMLREIGKRDLKVEKNF